MSNPHRLLPPPHELGLLFEEYSGYGDRSIERVRFVLMKLSAKEDWERQIKNNPDKGWSISDDLIAIYNKFIIDVVRILGALPKPKDWRSLYNNDLPLLTSIDEDVQEISVLAIRPRRPTTTHRNPKNWRKPGSRLPVVSTAQ